MGLARHSQVIEQALAWVHCGKGAALATVIQTWGSAPRPIGSQLAISSEAELAGSVSGGCVEGAVAAEALDALEDGVCRILSYGVSDDEAFAVGLACGGEIRILVEPIDVGDGPSVDVLSQLAAARAAREAVVMAVNLSDWSRKLLRGPNINGPASIALLTDKSAHDGDWFLGVHNPPLRLAVIGAVHIAQALMPMARLAGYDATLIDPREAFAAEARFPGERMITEWPDEALERFGMDARTAVVTLTHDSKLDDPAIIAALRAPVFYLGSLGSKKTHAKRVARLVEAGFSQEDIARIHGPVGLDIGAKSPAEIAIAILAEMTERLRRPAA
jgi:xanthine dehydrogenase accessory factor